MTQCVLFPELFDTPLGAEFDQSHTSSDGGAVLLRRGCSFFQAQVRVLAVSACLRQSRPRGWSG